jgi:nucleoside-diphosphate-sugar epimerase
MVGRTRRVVVTGGAGFIGSHLVDRLLTDDTDVEVTVLDNLRRGQRAHLLRHADDPRFRFVEQDVRGRDGLEVALRGADLVYHLAAQPTVIGGVDDASYTFDTNVGGTFNVLRAAALNDVKRVVFASSRQVYGEPINLPVDEEAPLMAINLYGATKLSGEALCRAYRRETGLSAVVLRLANVYGPRDTGRVIPLWLDQVKAGQDLVVYGGKQVLDFVWVGDAVAALERAGAALGPLPPINVGSGTGTKLLDLARRLGRLVGGRPTLLLQPARPAEVTRYIGKTERMRELLQLEPSLDPLGHLSALVAPGLVAAEDLSPVG